jgi:hypothetical protein
MRGQTAAARCGECPEYCGAVYAAAGDAAGRWEAGWWGAGGEEGGGEEVGCSGEKVFVNINMVFLMVSIVVLYQHASIYGVGVSPLTNFLTYSSPIACSLNFWIFPLAVFGKWPSARMMCLGTRWFDSRSLTHPFNSSRSTFPTPSAVLMNAATTSPYRSSFNPTTDTSWTASCARRQFSISRGCYGRRDM